MNQVLLGAAIPFVIALLIYTVRGFRASERMLWVTPLAMCVCGVWAIVPDIPRLLRMETLYLKLAADPRMNIFLFHYNIDQWEGEHPAAYNVAFMVMFLCLVAAAWRELRKKESV